MNYAAFKRCGIVLRELIVQVCLLAFFDDAAGGHWRKSTKLLEAGDEVVAQEQAHPLLMRVILVVGIPPCYVKREAIVFTKNESNGLTTESSSRNLEERLHAGFLYVENI